MSVLMNRPLKYINIVIGIALVTALITAYWVIYRPLPQTSGTIGAPLETAAEIVRDERGVPHIEAASEEDAVFLQGFVTAQDRIFQMDLARRKAAGELAEVLGASLVESDREARTLRLRQIAESHHRSLRPDELKAFAAYARGVNFYLETHRHRLPVDFRALEYEPRPWSVVDSILVGLQVFHTLSNSWRTDLLKSSLISSGDAEKVRSLFPSRSGLEPAPGSNAWAISDQRTKTGKPILANDPHLNYSVPSFWYQAHLKTPDLNVAGMSIPGLPGVIIGHNETIGWGVTSLPFDVQDLYAERLDPRTGRYVYQDQLLQAAREQDRIRVRGGEAVTVSTWVTRHGPVVAARGEMQVALRWTAAEPGAFRFPYLEINRATNWQEFRAALTGFGGPPLNLIYADVAGNIGYQAAGWLPVRQFDGSEVAEGNTGDGEWQGYIPFDELPSIYNPPSGMVISANENPFPEDYPHRVNGRFAPGYRTRRIRELLLAGEDWTAGDQLTIQTDVHDTFLAGLSRQVVAAYESRGIQGSNLDEIIGLLKEWDGQMEADEVAPLVALLTFQHLRRAVAEKAASNAGVAYDFPMSTAVIEGLLRDRPEGWFENWDQLVLRSLVDAIEEGKRSLGEDTGKWSYGRHNRLELSGGVLTRLPLIGSYFRLDPVSLNGSQNTIQQVQLPLGPSMRMALDAGNWDASLASLTLGQSGQRFSAHFDDQWESYCEGRALPLQYQQVSGQGRLQVVPAR